MGLETATYISDLVSTNPAAGDSVSQGDDHIRLLKSTIKATFPNVNGAVSATDEQLNSPTNATSQASTSGTAINFTSIPSWVKRITVSFVGVSTNGTSLPLIQIGDSGGYETSGYLGANSVTTNAGSTITANATTGFLVAGSVAAVSVIHGVALLTLADAATFTWAFSISGGSSNTAAALHGGGSKSLTATLDRLRITTVNGTDTFDAGLINIQYD